MSSAGRAVNSSGCVTTPKEREIGLSGFAAQIRPSSFTGSYGMATAEHREPCESRGSRTVLGAPGGEIPPGDSTKADMPIALADDCFWGNSGHSARRVLRGHGPSQSPAASDPT
jgi:methylmalonyl-CoA mutase cobalamin-binding subunit